MVVLVTKKKINERNLLVGILKLSLILIEYMPVFLKHSCLNMSSVQCIIQTKQNKTKNQKYRICKGALYALYTVAEKHRMFHYLKNDTVSIPLMYKL